MPRTSTGRRLRALALVAVCGYAGLMSGCSAGRISQTATMVPAVPGSNADSRDGKTSVRDVLVVPKVGGYRAGELAPLSLHVFDNDPTRTFTLVGVTSDVGDVCLSGTGAVPTGSASPSATASSPNASPTTGSPSPSADTTATPSTGASPTASPTSPSPSPSATCNGQLRVPVPPFGFVTLSRDAGPYLAVRLTRALPSGGVVLLSFTFDDQLDSNIENVPATVAPPVSAPPRSPLPLQPGD